MNKEVNQLILKIGIKEYLESTIDFLDSLEQDERVSELQDNLSLALNNYIFNHEPEALIEQNEELKRKLDRADTDFTVLSEHYEQLVHKNTRTDSPCMTIDDIILVDQVMHGRGNK